MNSAWQKYLLYGSVGAGLLFIIFETVRLRNTGFETKTLWDWMELLIIPLFLAGGAFFLNRSERENERQIAADRQQESALQSYLDRMTELLLKENLRDFKNEEVRKVARIRTLTVLRGLDAPRKALVLLFLKESELIRPRVTIIDLSGADFTGANLARANLPRVNLSNADLSGADLSRSNLSGSNLTGVNFSRANLYRTDFTEARLHKAIFTRARLNESDFTEAYLVQSLFYKAYLRGADFSAANVSLVNFLEADLTDAEFSGAMLTSSNPSEEQLARARTLRGAILPNGKQHD